MYTKYSKCELCPRKCGVDRNSNIGFCGATSKAEINRIDLHYMEEPIISGKNGSGTVFFTHCTMNCIFCQNYEISRRKSKGTEFSAEELAREYINLENRGAHNINLVSPTHYMPTIIESIEISRKMGLNLPFVYNTSGFENPEIIKILKGYIDIFLTDYKYSSPYLAKNFSNCEDYPDYIISAISNMVEITGKPLFSDDGMLLKGTIIRHLMLPNQLSDTLQIMGKVQKYFDDKVLFSLMRQYTPMGENLPDELNRTINDYEYSVASEKFGRLGLYGFIQSDQAVGTDKIPKFNL